MDAELATSVRALVARAGDRWCAVPLQRVRRVIPTPRVHPLPGASDIVSGLAEVEGDPLVILDLRQLVGAPQGAPAEHPVTLIVQAGSPSEGEILGLSVDEAGDITRLRPDDLVGTPHGIVRGETESADRVLLVLDLALLSEAR